MKTIHRKDEQARFDARLSKEQKLYFEKAALLGGYRSLTDFIILTVQEKAGKIISEREKILSSQKDCETFFNEITKTTKPNRELSKAAQEYNALLAE